MSTPFYDKRLCTCHVGRNERTRPEGFGETLRVSPRRRLRGSPLGNWFPTDGVSLPQNQRQEGESVTPRPRDAIAYDTIHR